MIYFENCSTQVLHCADHDRTYSFETTSRDCFDINQTKSRWRLSGEPGSKYTDTVLFWGYDETKVLLDIWADEAIGESLFTIFASLALAIQSLMEIQTYHF